MEIYFDQIPEGYDTSDYPAGTLFILDDSKPERDPITFKRIPPKRRPLIFPEDLKK